MATARAKTSVAGASGALAAGATRYCIGCRYPLRDPATARCPECGRAFDPSDPRTTTASPHGDTRLALAATARAVTAGAVVLAIVVVLGSALGVDPLLLLLPTCALSPFALVLAVLVSVPSLPIRARTRVAAVVAIVVIASVPPTHWPFRVTFALHRAAFQSHVDAVGPLPPSGVVPGAPTRVGVYRVREVRIGPNGNVGFQLSGGAGGGAYLVRARSANPTVWWNTNWTVDLGGGWWLVEQD